MCIPSREMTQITDYCGIVSGRERDKAELFDVFYGSLATAPLISQCPMNIECKMTGVHRVGANEVFFGEIAQIYVDEQCITSNKPNLDLIQPFVLDSAAATYRPLGTGIAQAWSIGKSFKP